MTRRQCIWYYRSTGEAYDACQCDEGLQKGDILLIPSEKVVGLVDTWPYTVTIDHGDLHGVAIWKTMKAEAPQHSIEWAVELAQKLGWAVEPNAPHW